MSATQITKIGQMGTQPAAASERPAPPASSGAAARSVGAIVRSVTCTLESWCVREEDIVIASMALSGHLPIGS